jgi:hypothetical protein
MQRPEEVSSRIQGGLRKGLAVVNDAVGGIATVLSNADSAVRTVDQGLTGNRRAANPRDEQEVAEVVVGLVKRGRDAVAASEDPGSSEAVGHFREALSQMSRVAQPTGLASLLPDSPVDAVRMGMHDLRGSLALGRLVSGRGNLDDVDEVAGFADDLFGRIDRARVAITSRPNPAPAPANPAPQNPTRARPTTQADRPVDLPGCTAAEETLGVMGYLWGLSRGKGGFGVLKLGPERLKKAAAGARRMKAPEVAADIEAIAAKLPEVRSREDAAALLEEIEPVADRAWELGRKCGITTGRLQRAAAKERAAAAG